MGSLNVRLGASFGAMRWLVVISCVVWLGCEAAPAPNPASPGSTSAPSARPRGQVFGAPIAIESPTKLTAIIQSPDQYRDRPVLIEGEVTGVCQEMGCWMDVREGEGGAHIRMAGHKFFVPKNAMGKRALVQGVVAKAGTTACQDQGRCEATPSPEGMTRIEFEASGVELID